MASSNRIRRVCLEHPIHRQWQAMDDRHGRQTDHRHGYRSGLRQAQQGRSAEFHASIRNSEVGGVKKIPTISEPLLAVSASNLKSALIDPGYISLADAGL